MCFNISDSRIRFGKQCLYAFSLRMRGLEEIAWNQQHGVQQSCVALHLREWILGTGSLEVARQLSLLLAGRIGCIGSDSQVAGPRGSGRADRKPAGRRWQDLDDSPVTWHIVGDIAGAAADNGAGFDPSITEPWQLAVNGIY